MSDDEKGHFRQYIPKKFSKDHEKIIAAVNHIIESYAEQGYSLTVRQIYYQFVSRDWLPNRDSEYKRLGGIISAGRLAGLISWTAIEDRNRSLMGITTLNNPLDAVKQARARYHIDKWIDQPWRVEVWVEKAALEGVVGAICDKLQVDFFATRGYNSQSEQWSAGQRLARYIRKGQRPIIFHLGDHDPSGIDMTRDNRDRLSLFAGVPIMVQRLALNMDQVDQYNPPPNPTKTTDSRAGDEEKVGSYIERFGRSSWELDALDPSIISDLIEDAVLKMRDEKLWDNMLKKEVQEKLMLDEIIEMMGGKDTTEGK